jgi:hypothetical protein
LAPAGRHLDACKNEHHDASMRTTLTLDPDVARLLEEEMHRARKPFKQVVNDALRRALAPQPTTARRRTYRVQPHAARFLPGLDRARLNALADELEDTAIIERVVHGSSGAR